MFFIPLDIKTPFCYSKALMVTILDPKVDFVFKNLFGNKSQKRSLISLLNAIISPFEGRGIVEVQIDDSVIRKEHLEDKYSILDIKATLDDDSRVNIEMQMSDPGHMTKRLLYYLSRLYTEQLSSGGEYKDLRKTIVIGILNYNMLKNDSYEGIQKVGDFLNSNSNVGGVFWQLFMP